MQVTRVESSRERLILVGMIVSDQVVARIASRWIPEGLFGSDPANTVAWWCVTYYRKYNKAPNKQIYTIYRTWAETNSNEQTVRTIEATLTAASAEWKSSDPASFAVEHVLDVAGKYFNEIKLERLADQIQTCLAARDTVGGEELVAKHRRVELGMGSGVDLFLDKETVFSCLTGDDNDLLITYPGAANEFYRDTLSRDGFIAYMAPEKTGKSYQLLDVAYRGMRQRRRVAYFEAGDLSARQVYRRLMVRNSRHPLKSTNDNRSWPCVVNVPTKISKIRVSPDDPFTATVKRKEQPFQGPLNTAKAWESCQRVMREHVRSKESYFRISCHSNSSLSASAIDEQITTWSENGWHPDVVVIDYADILAPETDFRGHDDQDRINATWQRLRRISMDHHVLVVTATQADAASYTAKILGKNNFSRDKRKLAHATGIIGINVSKEEKKEGIARHNWIVLRENEFQSERVLYVAQCLSFADPCVVSCM